MYYDLHAYTSQSVGESSFDEMVSVAKRLGLSGLGVVRFPDQLHQPLPKADIDIVNCVMVKATTAAEMDDIVKKVRDKAEVVMVYGGNYDVNRAACSNPMVDVLCHPELGRPDSGLDHICMRAAQENKVAIELNFHEVLDSFKRNRVHILAAMRKNVTLARKYETPVITASGALSKWGLRAGRELAALANILGVELGKAVESVSVVPESIVKANREKLAGKRWEGVSIVGEKHGP